MNKCCYLFIIKLLPINFATGLTRENHSKVGGLWVVVEGRVYDVQDWKSQLPPCGADTLQQYAAKETTTTHSLYTK